MTPREAHTLAALVETIDDAGGEIRDVDVERKRAPPVSIASLLSSTRSRGRAVYTLEIVADPDVVLDEDTLQALGADVDDGEASQDDVDEAVDGVEITIDEDDDPADNAPSGGGET